MNNLLFRGFLVAGASLGAAAALRISSRARLSGWQKRTPPAIGRAAEAGGASKGKVLLDGQQRQLIDALAEEGGVAAPRATPAARLHEGGILAVAVDVDLAVLAVVLAGFCIWIRWCWAGHSVDDADRVWQPVARDEREGEGQEAADYVQVLALGRFVAAHERLVYSH